MRTAQIPIPGAEEALAAAVATNNWVIVLLVVLVIAILSGVCAVGYYGGGYVLRRLNEQDRYITDTLVRQVDICTRQIAESTEALHGFINRSDKLIDRIESRPCQWAEIRDGKLVIRAEATEAEQG